jgi:hypothetical protein
MYKNLMNLKIQVFLDGAVSFRNSWLQKNLLPSNSGCSSPRRTAMQIDRVYNSGVDGKEI